MIQELTPQARLLIVEKDRAVQDLLTDLLLGEGYAVDCAASLEDALALLCTQRFHFILTDLVAGQEKQPLSAIQTIQRYAPSTPVGIVTGWRLPPEQVTPLGLAFQLEKPFELDELLARIASSLDGSLSHAREPLHWQAAAD
jgi:two-component system response regulator BasR